MRIPVGGWGEKEREGEWEGEGEGRLVLIRAEFDEGMPERGIQLLHAQQAEDERDCVPRPFSILCGQTSWSECEERARE